ncbi:MAG: cyclase family protein [Verrucomicrobia bacterium]|nr:cyclase family protein [Verrucomicrobiota bacterium]
MNTVPPSSRYADLSHPMYHGAPAFPNDPITSVQPRGTIAREHYNTSEVSFGTHQGTHLDAMFHFFDDGRTLEQMPLAWFHGAARMLRIPKAASGEITVADLEPFSAHFVPEAKIIVNTGWHRRFGQPEFFTDFPSFTLDAARYLAARRIRLLGMDLPTPGKQWLELHHILLAKNIEIVLVESLANLDAVPETFTFVGFPLNFRGRDGSPIRAVGIWDAPLAAP